jgi:glycosyltransferase involved in cell wall biosynthesis
MKILLVCNRFHVEDGGSYTAVSELSHALNAKEIFTKVVHNNNNNNLFRLTDHFSIVKNFDIVHIFGIWNPFVNLLIFIAKKLKKKIIVSPIGFLEPWSLQQSKIKKKIAWHFYQKKVLEKCDYIHATSKNEFSSLEKLNLKNVNLIFLPHGKLNKIYSDIEILEKNKKNKVMLFFSRIHKKKGLLELVEAWNLIKPQDWELNIIGPVSDLNYKKKIDKKIIEYDLSSVIYYSHPVYDSFSKNLKFKNSDIIILPSKNENFAFSVCEAMFASRIVLCSNQTPWEEVNKAEIGYCLDLSSKENIFLALKKIFNVNKNKLHEMGKKARDYMLPKYDLENVIIYKYIEFYKSLISKK